MVHLIEARDIVRRILFGQVSVANFDRLFLWLRQHPNQRKSVRDVGDFVAHSDRRERGVAWDFVKALSDSLKYHSEMSQKIIVSKETAIAHLEALKLLEPADLVRKDLGVGQRKAHKIINDIVARLVDVNEEGWKFRPKLDEIETKVFRRYMQVFAWRPAFTDASLMEDLIFVLGHHKVLKKEEIEDFRKSVLFLGKYVTLKMHLTLMTIGEGEEPIRLHAGWTSPQPPFGIPNLCVYADIGRRLMSIFETGCIIAPPHVDGSITIFMQHLWPPIFGRPFHLDDQGVLSQIFEEPA